LLSVAPPLGLVPGYRPVLGPDGVTPLATPGPTGMTPTQIRHAYGFDQISFSGGTITGDGSGTTIAIVDAYDDPKIANDLRQFDLRFGLPDPPTFTKVNQYGGTTMPVADGGWAGEIALDVEWAHAIAPKANILLVEAADNSFSNLLAAVDYARHATGVVAVSMSWGGGEFSGEKSYDAYFTTPGGPPAWWWCR
jgi:subtilase family serine protease